MPSPGKLCNWFVVGSNIVLNVLGVGEGVHAKEKQIRKQRLEPAPKSLEVFALVWLPAE